MALTSPVEFAQIVDSYIDGWRKEGWLPETRANNLPGWTQGCVSCLLHTCTDDPTSALIHSPFSGSSADNILSHFAVHYHNEAAALGIDLEELYAAVLTDGEKNPPEWNIYGRQINVYK